MTVQPDLFGGQITVEPRLTAYQQAVLEHVQSHPDGVSADEAGAIAHAMKTTGRGHGADSRCDWCGKQGRSILDALVKKGLVRRRQGGGRFLYCPTTTATTAPEAREGFDEHGFPEDY